MTEDILQEVSARWPTADEYYRERDNRTELEVPELRKYATWPVEILVDPRCAHRPTVQKIALLACNLTARWARHVRVLLPEVPVDRSLARHGHGNLGGRIKHEMRAADPFGDFQVAASESEFEGSRAEPPLRLFIGPWAEAGRKGQYIGSDDYLVHAYSWTAAGVRGAHFPVCSDQEATAAAAGFAAAVGVADIFKRAVGHRRSHWLPDFSWCTWSHSLAPRPLGERALTPPPPEILELGLTLLAGVGAIGSAFIYLADFMKLRGRLTLLDRDFVETSNLNRSPLFDVMHVLTPTAKTTASRDYLRSQDAEVEIVNGTWHEHAAKIGESPFDVWISLTNEDGAWAEVPYQLPPVVLHGTTTSGWGIGTGRHIPRRDDCTICRMPHPTAPFRGRCAEGEIQSASTATPVSASLPFLSTAAAALLLAEFMKLGTPSLTRLPNDVSADFRYGLPALVALRRVADPGCRGCRASLSAAWLRRGGRGRYGSYSCIT